MGLYRNLWPWSCQIVLRSNMSISLLKELWLKKASVDLVYWCKCTWTHFWPFWNLLHIMISGSTLEIDSSWIISPLTNAMINIGQLLVLALCRPHFLPFKEKFDHLKRICKVTLQIFVGSYRQWDTKKWRTKFHLLGIHIHQLLG